MTLKMCVINTCITIMDGMTKPLFLGRLRLERYGRSVVLKEALPGDTSSPSFS